MSRAAEIRAAPAFVTHSPSSFGYGAAVRPGAYTLVTLPAPAAAAAVLALCGFALTACSSGPKSDPNDPNAGLDAEILSWRNDLQAQQPLCRKKVDGQGCVSFEVTCKAMQTITPAEAAKGVNAKVVAAMTYSGHDKDGASSSGSAFAMFSKAGGKWSRAEARPVNMSTCAPL